jgi:hypothetical protein
LSFHKVNNINTKGGGKMLIGHWPLNGNANDISGNGYNGTPFNLTYTAGKVGQAGNFNGTSSYIIRNSADGFPTGNVTATISAWVYFRSFTSTWQGIAGWGIRTTGRRLMISTFAGRFSMNTWGSLDVNDIITDSADVLSTGRWYHLTGTIQDKRIKLYIDGILKKDQTLTGTPNIAAQDITIGSIDSPGRYSDALINDVRIYDYALTDMEIQELTRAKILHYTFDDFQEPTTNLWSNTNGRATNASPGGTTPPTVELISMTTPFGNQA